MVEKTKVVGHILQHRSNNQFTMIFIGFYTHLQNCIHTEMKIRLIHKKFIILLNDTKRNFITYVHNILLLQLWNKVFFSNCGHKFRKETLEAHKCNLTQTTLRINQIFIKQSL